MNEQLTLDDLTLQLAEIRDRLLQTAPDDFAGKYRLKREQDRLRSQAKVFVRDRDAFRTSKDLLAELEVKRSSLEAINKQMIYLREGVEANIAMRAAAGTDTLIQRIEHLETVLKERGVL